jgi:hypothetical protein
VQLSKRLQTPGPLYIVDGTQFEPFEIGAALTSIITFPCPDQIDDRGNACTAGCAWAVREYSKESPENAAWWRARYPDYACVDKKCVDSWMRKIQRRLNQRIIAGRIALGYFDEALRNMFVTMGERYPDLRTKIGDIESYRAPLPEGVARHSLNAVIEHFFPNNSSTDGNIETRIWRPSLPAIHLAAALYVLSRSRKPNARELPWCLDDRSFQRDLVQLALVHEEALHNEWARRSESRKGSATFAINPDILIRCRTVAASTVF